MGTTIGRSSTNFILNPLWDKARWSATTFRWHPTGNAPPVMGLCFDNATPAQEIFSQWLEKHDNRDSLEELRISIIEWDIPGQRLGYSIHICADPESALARATMEGVVTDSSIMLLSSRVNRMHPVPGSPPLLPHFKRDYLKHKEFMLAPVTRRWDGQMWVDLEFGIIKTKIHFRNAADIGERDIDSVVFRQPSVTSQTRQFE